MADTSLVVVAFATWHEHHASARRVLDGGVRLIEHCALETYSVLTRLPPPHRAPTSIVVSFLEGRFPRPWLSLPASDHQGLLRQATENDITGGALYDALVAATVKHAGATLVTRDRRAVRIYEALGASFRLLE